MFDVLDHVHGPQYSGTHRCRGQAPFVILSIARPRSAYSVEIHALWFDHIYRFPAKMVILENLRVAGPSPTRVGPENHVRAEVSNQDT